MSRLVGVATAIAWLAAVLMLFQVSLDILGKFLFAKPVAGTAEVVASYYMIALVFMALPLVEQRRDTIMVDLLYDRMGPRMRMLSRIVGLVFTLAFYLAFSWTTFETAMKSMAIREVVLGAREFQIWPSRFFLPTGCFLAALVVLLRQVDAILHGAEVRDGPR